MGGRPVVYKGMLDCFRQILRHEGACSAAAWQAVPAWQCLLASTACALRRCLCAPVCVRKHSCCMWQNYSISRLLPLLASQ